LIWAERSLAKNPRHLPTLRTLIVAEATLGKHVEARENATKLVHIDPEFSVSAWTGRTPLQGDVLRRFQDAMREAQLPK
jgi:hypothetical protein